MKDNMSSSLNDPQKPALVQSDQWPAPAVLTQIYHAHLGTLYEDDLLSFILWPLCILWLGVSISEVYITQPYLETGHPGFNLLQAHGLDQDNRLNQSAGELFILYFVANRGKPTCDSSRVSLRLVNCIGKAHVWFEYCPCLAVHPNPLVQRGWTGKA
jgi:hypothetical protein